MKQTLLRMMLVGTTGCVLPAPSPAPRKAAARHEPDTSFLLVPYGPYVASTSTAAVELALASDHSFALRWNDAQRMERGQWTGRYEWKQVAIGESLHLFEVSGAVNERRLDGAASEQLAVTRVDRERNQFAIPLRHLGTVQFRPRP